MSARYTSATAAALICLATGATAGQLVIVTPPSAALFNNVVYDVDYATAGKIPVAGASGVVDTIVSIGLPKNANTGKCAVQVVWYDFNGSLAGISSFAVAGGETQEFTTSVNSGNPGEYAPFTENVFSNLTQPFEGHAEIRVQNASCTNVKALRVDAEFAVVSFNSAGVANPVIYKSIAVSAPVGVKGY